MSTRGMGRIYRPSYTSKRTGERKQQSVWWVDYSVDGKRYRQSTRSSNRKGAQQFLVKRLNERGRGVPFREFEKVRFSDLAALIESDYRKNRRRSIARLQNSLSRLGMRFEGWRAMDITEAAIDPYITERLREGAAPATVNRELAALRRMFRLGLRARLVRRVPIIEMLSENNVRKGFVEKRVFLALYTELPEYLRCLVETAYLTGWRRNELLSRRWRHVDLDAGWLRLDPGETKNGEGRQFPLRGRLREAMTEQAVRKTVVERQTGRIVDALFFHLDGAREGEPIREFKRAWASACRRAGCPQVLFHDFRRTAARDMVRAGIAEAVAMKLTGHLTSSIFKRYAIVDERMLIEGADRLAKLHEGTATPNKEVLAIGDLAR